MVDRVYMHMRMSDASYHCGVPECTSDVWATSAANGKGTCGGQITWVHHNIAGMKSLSDACAYVARQPQTPECAACSNVTSAHQRYPPATPPSPPTPPFPPLRPSRSGQPDLAFFLVDDLGYADLTQSYMPMMHALEQRGVTLRSYYVHPLCTPSRAAFLTGRMCYRYGLCHYIREAVVWPNERPCTQGPNVGTDEMALQSLDTGEVLLPQMLSRVGYRTFAVGKWHIEEAAVKVHCGPASQNSSRQCSRRLLAQTPTWRGFDSWLGFFGVSEQRNAFLRVRTLSLRARKLEC